MACFPRFFVRHKNSFNPAEDDNTDTLLDTSENSVQIGRYVKREETPLFTPKSSEQQLLRQSEISNNIVKYTNDVGNNTNNTNNNNTNNTNNNNNNTNGNNINHKKFVSNKHQNNNFYNNIKHTNNNNTNTNTIKSNNNNNDNNNTNSVHTNAHHKFKPVKQRRPTALPSEALHLEPEEDDDDEDEHDDGAGDAVDAVAPSNEEGVKFFIGQREEEAEAEDEPETSPASVKGSVRKDEEATPTKGSARPKLFTQTSVDSAHRGVAPKHSKSRLPSNSSYKHRKTKSDAPGDLEPALNIPPPPPLPPQPLPTASSSTSLVSQKTSRTRRHSKSTASASHRNLNGNPTISEVPSTSLNGRDSGVQVEDQTSTPKDSDGSSSPKSHRVEGGLIFMRPNLPVKTDVEIEFIRKDESTRNLIRSAIEKNDFLNNYMDRERKEMVIDAMEPAAYAQDSFIIREREEGSEIFVSEEGYFEVIKDDKVIGNIGPGTVFGELAILYNAPRFASIKAVTAARVWKIDRGKFRNIMVISGSRERQENLNFLRSAPFLQELEEEVLDKVVDLLQRKFYETNTCIVREGEVGNEFFIIRGGTVTIKKRNEYDEERVVDRRKRGEYFGEQALINADRRQASVYADAPGTECLKLDREAFISYLGTIPQLRETPVEREVEGRTSDRKSEFQNEYANIELADLKKIATLGAGAFGRVDLVAHGNKTFALKIIKKIDIIKQDQVDHVYSEKHVMMKCSRSPFIIELYKTYRNDKFVYFLMEACMGGDVWTVMSQRRFFDEKTARFIAGCVVEAFDYLHSHNIIYRDLKPENLMLTTDGYCKLVDFGFAKHVAPNQKTNTFAGTPEYVAPEIILDRGHDRSVDYWALGILIFELLVGKTPFRGQNQIKIYQQILGGIDVIQMPSKIPKSAQGLIKHLCKQLPVERLGYQRRGILDIKRHSWFDSLDWSKLKKKQLVSPIQRPITSNTDIQYFVPCGSENDHDPPDETSGWDLDF